MFTFITSIFQSIIKWDLNNQVNNNIDDVIADPYFIPPPLVDDKPTTTERFKIWFSVNKVQIFKAGFFLSCSLSFYP